MRRTGVMMLAVVAIAAIACGGETSAPTRTNATTGLGNGGGTDTSGSPPPSAGPVASVTITPKSQTLRVGYYMQFTATPRDAKGVFVAGKHASWSSSNSAVLVASDTGVFYAKGVGTAKVYGLIDGYADTATVTVVVAPPDTTITNPPPAPVSSFNLTLTIDGAVAGADTSQTQHVGGVTVTVTRVNGVQGDTLNPAALAGTITTDANGNGSLQNLPGGSYRFVATPPAGSPYQVSTFGISAPTVSSVGVRIVLRRTP